MDAITPWPHNQIRKNQVARAAQKAVEPLVAKRSWDKPELKSSSIFAARGGFSSSSADQMTGFSGMA